MRNKNLKIFNDYLQCLLRQEMLVLRKKLKKNIMTGNNKKCHI